MPPVIRLPQKTFERLQKHAIPLTDTPASVIERLLDAYEEKDAVEPVVPSKKNGIKDNMEDMVFSGEEMPDLHHTRILVGKFGRQSFKKWNDLVAIAHNIAIHELGSFEAVSKITHSNIVRGERKDKGFKYLPEVDISIQYVDANLAWKNACYLAKQIGLTIKAEIEWLGKKNAAYPSKKAILQCT